MGYMTDFEIELQAPNPDEDVSAYMTEEQAAELFDHLYDYGLYRNGDPYARYREAKWYECDTDCKGTSAAYPDVVIRVYGQGEEAGDVWVKWWQAGQMLRHWKLELSVPDRYTDAPEPS